MRSRRASYAEALTVTCPECKSPPHNSCVYLPLMNYDENVVPRSWRIRKRILMTGTPTDRPHNGRFNAVLQKRWRQATTTQRRETINLTVSNDASPEVRAIAYAHQQWDREEWLRLATWLRCWGCIFEEE